LASTWCQFCREHFLTSISTNNQMISRNTEEQKLYINATSANYTPPTQPLIQKQKR
jgi:hypothetical protein